MSHRAARSDASKCPAGRPIGRQRIGREGRQRLGRQPRQRARVVLDGGDPDGRGKLLGELIRLQGGDPRELAVERRLMATREHFEKRLEIRIAH